MSIEHLLNKRFGIRKLNEEQRIIIDSILNNEDVLALMPTGSGKSITFQLPVVFTEGRALVITPLIALMEDQVMQLKMSKINAVAIHGGLSRAELSIITHRIDSYQFIYCSPEWLQSELAEALFSRIKFTHVVLDEAHCISQWGFQFRPHYLLVNEVIDRHNAQVIALTATATKKIILDIEEIIGRSLKVHDFLKNKDNMYLYKYEVHEDDKLKFLQKVLRESGPSIIY
ncbi:MAG: DEAD/DEAH box helicase, partial [Macrococcoides caseolyticum]